MKLHGSNLHFYKDASEPLPFEVISLLGYSVHDTAGTNSPVGQVRFKFILQSEVRILLALSCPADSVCHTTELSITMPNGKCKAGSGKVVNVVTPMGEMG